MEREKFLEEVIGLDEVKDELFNIVSWFKNSEIYEKRGIDIPRGVVLIGSPGNGKSLILKNLIKYLDLPTYFFPDDTRNIVRTLDEIFKKASLNEKSIIIIDEIDLLMESYDSALIKRSFQENMDGIEKNNGKLLVLAACNSDKWLTSALSREGRFSRILKINTPDNRGIKLILKKIFSDFDISDNYLTEDEALINLFESRNFSEIKGIVTDSLLRKKDKCLRFSDFLLSYDLVCGHILPSKFEPSFNICVHEAGHALIGNKFKDIIRPSHVIVSKHSGYFRTTPECENLTYKHKIVMIQISFGGTLAEKLIFNNALTGNTEDLGKAKAYASSLVSNNGYKSLWRTLIGNRSDGYRTSEFKLRKNEIIFEKLLKKLERKTYLYLRKNKTKLIRLANEIKNKLYLSANEIDKILNS